jgi:CheY-like chemotaxis protein
MSVRIPTILIADDSQGDRGLLLDVLEGFDCRVVEARDGAEAIEMALVEQPDVAVLDVRMPELSGWEVCRYIKSNATLSTVRVLMLTSIGERLNDMQSPLYGADAHLDKPFDIDALVETVGDLASRNGAVLRARGGESP